jgi:hypothetical protein
MSEIDKEIERNGKEVQGEIRGRMIFDFAHVQIEKGCFIPLFKFFDN